jgi:hypothetical protein
VSKAFDTIPHEVIGPALRRHGIPQEVTSLIIASYRNLKTTVNFKDSHIPLELRRGVK